MVAGSPAAISTAEVVLRTDQRFQKLRFQRLKTSHGFHSALSKPILSELETFAESLKWSEPSIRVYSCTKTPKSYQLTARSHFIAQHARQPVFFSHAINTIEGDLGPCVWVEAGVDTPILSMTRKACQQPDAHIFQPVKLQGVPRPTDAICDIVSGLWRAGIFLSHWALINGPHGDPTAGQLCRPVWLPPYQFAQTRHWVENIDRTVETQNRMQAQLDCIIGPVSKIGSHSPPLPLVIRRQTCNARTGYAEFFVDTKNPRFRSIVKGHVVCSHSLCPAPMYMECATAALLLLLPYQDGATDQVLKPRSPTFEQLHISSPLGVDPEGEVILRLEEIPSVQQAWKLTISFIKSGDASKAEKAHADGVISLGMEPMLESFERLISKQMSGLIDSYTSEKIHSNRAYKLFSHVVQYGEFFKGI